MRSWDEKGPNTESYEKVSWSGFSTKTLLSASLISRCVFSSRSRCSRGRMRTPTLMRFSPVADAVMLLSTDASTKGPASVTFGGEFGLSRWL